MNSKIVIGCDPDSNKSGIALYKDGKLIELSCKSLVDVYTEFNCLSHDYDDVELHIENLNGNSSNAFNVRSRQSLAVKNENCAARRAM